MKKTIVKFLIDKDSDGNSVFAYFPKIKYKNSGVEKLCYSPIGQHGCCDPEYARKCKPATTDQYKPLLSELESIGYNLKIK